jgi:hypothetical protein
MEGNHAPDAGDLRQALAGAITQAGESLLTLTERAPLLLVFLRHFG